MASTQPRTMLTYADYMQTSDDRRYELLEGVLVEMTAPNTAHQRASREIGRSLDTFVRDRGLGEVFFAPYDVVLSDTVVAQPDLLFVSNERAHVITAANIQGTPDLVVEVLSDSTARNDWTLKRDLYARHGVSEYWLVDPVAWTVTVLLLRDERFRVVEVYSEGQTLASPTLAGLSLNLAEIFQSVSRI